MITRTGKIAQLPKSIRDELNRRLENGQQSPELLRWLNGLPAAKKILAKKFACLPFTTSNLSRWRHGGFQEWRRDQARQEHIQHLSESGAALAKAESGDLFQNLARIAAAELMADLDSLEKLRGAKRSQSLHNFIRDLARLQNSHIRSRWATLAWTKYNDTRPPETPSDNVTAPPASPCPSTSVAPDGGELQAGSSRDSETEPPFDPLRIIHHTKCDCGEPCPKCHAPDSEYPLDEVLRDKEFYKKHSRHPHDRHGRPRHLMNFDCDCFCDRCAENAARTLPTPIAAAVTPTLLLPASPDEIPPNSNPHRVVSEPSSPLSPFSPLSPSLPRTADGAGCTQIKKHEDQMPKTSNIELRTPNIERRKLNREGKAENGR